VIASYGDNATRDIHFGNNTQAARKLPHNIWPVAQRKLNVIHAATTLGDISTPGNGLEKLKGDLKGSYSIRINAQWRIVFDFGANGQATDVRIADYH
jgi:toxin HigB-1